MYQGNSVVDYLRSTGQKYDYATRASLAASKGITGYTGSAEQNTQLLNLLRGSGNQVTPPPAPTPQPKPQASAPVTPTYSPTPTSTPVSSGQPRGASDLVAMGYYGYKGWGDTEAVNDFRDTKGAGKGGPASFGGGAPTDLGISQPTLDLPSLYDNLYNSSGINDIENRIKDKTLAYNQATANIKDNPYLSEATMTGRLRKLDDKFNADTQAERALMAMKKADVETRINLQTKQFDINNTLSQQALSKFGSLLESGALDNIGGEEIANLTRSTGLSSGLIMSAVQARKLKNMSTQIKTFDDGVNEGFTIYTIDPMGNIVNQSKQVTGPSSKKSVGNYSADPAVSAYIQAQMDKGKDISQYWEGVY